MAHKDTIFEFLDGAKITGCTNTSVNGFILYLTWDQDTSSPIGMNKAVVKIATTFSPGVDRRQLPEREGKNNQIQYEMEN